MSRRRTDRPCAPARAVCAAALFALLPAGACSDYPGDPERTLERTRGAVLVVGGTDSPPWLVRTGSGAAGPEAELIEELAATLDSRVEWRWGALEEQLEALERFELAMVAGGLTRATPWKARVALTRPWIRAGEADHVLAVPPGENAMLMAVDRFVEGRRRAGADRLR